MCVKSHRHLCLQIFLIILLVACLLAFSAIILADVGLYLLTSSASTVQDESPTASPSAAISAPVSPVSLSNDQQIILLDPATNMTVQAAAAQTEAKTDQDESDGEDDQGDALPLADWLAYKIANSSCSWFNSTVQSGQLLQICDSSDPFSTDRTRVQCFRTTILYKGLASILPFTLVLLSTIAVCRLMLCPILTLAIVYILLAIALVVGAILFDSGVIVNNIDTEDSLPALFHMILSLVVLYTVLSLLHILLFALVTCEQRRLRCNGDAEKIMKQSTDDEDDIDDPKAPLYENGFSPQKKNDFEEKIKDLKYIDDDMSYIFRKG